jgi:hypothetical protein
MIRQQQILKEIAKRHGLPDYQVEEIWIHFTQGLSSQIGQVRKDEDKQFILEDFPIIHIDNFGKFTPRINFIKRLNKRQIHKENEQS